MAAGQPVVLDELVAQPVPRAGAAVARIGIVDAAVERRGESHQLERGTGRIGPLRRPVQERLGGVVQQRADGRRRIGAQRVERLGIVSRVGRQGAHRAVIGVEHGHRAVVGCRMRGDGVGQRLLHRGLELQIERGVDAARRLRLAVGQQFDHLPGRIDDAQDAAALAVQILLAPRLQPGDADHLVAAVAAGLKVGHLIGRDGTHVADDVGGRIRVGVEAHRPPFGRGQAVFEIRLQRQGVLL